MPGLRSSKLVKLKWEKQQLLGIELIEPKKILLDHFFSFVLELCFWDHWWCFGCLIPELCWLIPVLSNAHGNLQLYGRPGVAAKIVPG